MEDLPAGFETGSSFKTPCINPPVYLDYLARQLRRLDVAMKRGSVSHIADAADLHDGGSQADIVINCTGLAAAKLGGVEDSTVFPARGQICLVKNTCRGLVTTSGTDDGPFDVFYVQPRANGRKENTQPHTSG